MRGLSATEQRSEQLRSWTFLGLLADDVALATARYPDASESQDRAVAALLDLVAPPAEAGATRPVIPRRRSMADPSAILREAAVLTREASQGPSQTEIPDLDFIRTPLRSMLDRTASDDELRTVRAFAEVLARVTLSMTEELAHEKAPIEWTTRASLFSFT
jgi:hypothetical protein